MISQYNKANLDYSIYFSEEDLIALGNGDTLIDKKLIMNNRGEVSHLEQLSLSSLSHDDMRKKREDLKKADISFMYSMRAIVTKNNKEHSIIIENDVIESIKEWSQDKSKLFSEIRYDDHLGSKVHLYAGVGIMAIRFIENSKPYLK